MRKNQVLLCLIVILTIFSACKKDNGFGSNLLPGETLLDLIYDEDISMTTSSKFEDPLRTDRILYNFLGFIDHPIYGKTTASSTTQFGLPDELDLDLGPFTVKQVEMFLFYDNYFGDTTVPVSFSVHTLTSAMDESRTYKSNYIPSYNSTPLGEVNNFLLTPNTAQLLRESDTLKAKGFVKFPIDNAFGESVRDLLQTGLITNDTLFNNRFPGVYIQTNPSQLGKTMIQLDLTNLSAGVFVHLVDKNGEDQVIMLPFATSNFTHTTLLHEYSGTRIESAVQSGENPTDEKLFIQSQAGVKTEVKFNNIEKFKGMLINKAVLEVYEVEKPITGYLRALNVYPLLKGASGENVALTDYTSAYYGPAIRDTTAKSSTGEDIVRYQINITNLFKDYARGKTDLSSIYLANYPVFLETPRFILDANSVLSQHVEPASLILGSPNYSDPEKRMKLKVWYTTSK